MREIAGPHQALDVAKIAHLEGDVVVLERRVHVLAEILTWHLRKRAGREPVAVAVVCMIHPVHIVRHPSGVRFDANYFQLWMALENSAQNERADDVLASADDRQEAVELGPARLE